MSVGDPITLDATSGMIDMPVETLDGVILRALINPQLAVSPLIRLNSDDIVAGERMARRDLPVGGSLGEGKPLRREARSGRRALQEGEKPRRSVSFALATTAKG